MSNMYESAMYRVTAVWQHALIRDSWMEYVNLSYYLIGAADMVDTFPNSPEIESLRDDITFLWELAMQLRISRRQAG